ncbi:MAG: hypothetical protein Q7R22_010775 [Verrucomicrobiota bacterium JB025]|nr:hypothetical protein [Verrucomicrobiota bacterium JB025]
MLLFAVSSAVGGENSARIIGNLADGTASPPQPPKPEFVVDERDVLSERSFRQSGRTVTVKRIKPLPKQLVPKPPVAPELSEEEWEALVAEARMKRMETRFVFVSATVYDNEKTLLRWQLPNRAENDHRGRRSFEAWSNVDFLHLTGFGSFEYEGVQYDMIMGVSRMNTEAWKRAVEKYEYDHGVDLGYELPESPELPADGPDYVLTDGDASDLEGLEVMDGLHALYAKERETLVAAYEGRKKAREEREAYLKANPPRPEDVTLYFSRTERPAPEKGAGR